MGLGLVGVQGGPGDRRIGVIKDEREVGTNSYGVGVSMDEGAIVGLGYQGWGCESTDIRGFGIIERGKEQHDIYILLVWYDLCPHDQVAIGDYKPQ